jgi:hypothetical protein
LGADANDYDIGAGAAFNIGCTGADRTITGIAGGTEGRVIQLINTLGYNVTLSNEGTGSIAGNRILTALPANAPFVLYPNQSVFLTYNNIVNRWVLAHYVQTYDPPTDPVLSSLIRGDKSGVAAPAGMMQARNILRTDPKTDSAWLSLLCTLRNRSIRSGGMMAAGAFLQRQASQLGFLKAKVATKTSGTTSAQSFGVVSGCQASFTMPVAGDVVIFVAGSLKTQISTAKFTPNSQIGGRFDSDSAQIFNTLYMNNGAGSDWVDDFPLMGFWYKNLAAGSHTADLCWGSTGGYDLYSDSTNPAVVGVLYPG